MSGNFGLEGIRDFSAFRAATGDKKAVNFTYTYNVLNGVYDTLGSAGYSCQFYFAGKHVWELDMRSEHLGGNDKTVADDVDLFFIYTHATNGAIIDGVNVEGIIALAMNSEHDNWYALSKDWRMGDHAMEWLAIYGCNTIMRDQFGKKGWKAYSPIFHKLHMILGAYGDMHDGWTTEECGEDFAENLLDGDTLKAAWLDGVSDWAVNNHPAVISAETKATYNNGKPKWSKTTMNRDKFPGHGGPVSDIAPDKLYWLAIAVVE